VATQPLWREPYPDYLALSQLTPLREHFAVLMSRDIGD